MKYNTKNLKLAIAGYYIGLGMFCFSACGSCIYNSKIPESVSKVQKLEKELKKESLAERVEQINKELQTEKNSVYYQIELKNYYKQSVKESLWALGVGAGVLILLSSKHYKKMYELKKQGLEAKKGMEEAKERTIKRLNNP